MAKKAILENFPENETVKYYFECHFDILEEEQLLEIFGVKTFEEFDIAKAVEKLDYPDLLFGIEKNKEITFSVDYKVSEEYSDEILCVKMDEKLNITDFSHES
jgi:ADP-glucose pyrophosphorylase